MNGAPLIIALLIIAAITVQVVVFFVTLRIRRKSAEKEENVVDFADYKDRFESGNRPETQVQKTPDE